VKFSPFPFLVVVHWPRWITCRGTLGNWRFLTGTAVLLASLAAAVLLVPQHLTAVHQQESPVVSATLLVHSRPIGAMVLVDGARRGRTPATLSVQAGDHRITIHAAGYADVSSHVSVAAGSTATVTEDLWLITPVIQHLRPPLPGGSITEAVFLDDGRVALTMTLPPGQEHQLWFLGAHGGASRHGPPLTLGPLSVSPDGRQVAYLTATLPTSDSSAPLDASLTEVWVTGRDGERGERRYALPEPARDERLLDVRWSPNGQDLLLVSRLHQVDGGSRDRLVELAHGHVQDLITLPSQIVPGSFVWSQDGAHVGFLHRGEQQTSLCMVDLIGSSGGGTTFRSLADLGGGGRGLAVAPMSWSVPEDTLLYAAPVHDGTSAASPPVLSTVRPGEPARQLDHTVGQSPTWRPRGGLASLTKSSRGMVTVRSFDGMSRSTGDLEVPIPVSDTPSARWDLTHGQVVLAVRRTAGWENGVDWWLVRLRPAREGTS